MWWFAAAAAVMAKAKGEPEDAGALVAKLKENVAALDEEDPAFVVDEACCLRYLRARDWDLKKATKMLEETLKWRQSYGVRTLVDDKFPILETECATGKTYVSPECFDREGRATIIMRSKNENTFDHDGNVAHVVYQMERAVKAADEAERDKWNIMIDFEGYSLRNAPPMKTSRATLSVMQDHNPERLHKAFLVDAPWLFNAFFKLISPFIDPVTRAKIVFVRGSPDQRAKVLAEHFDLADVEKALGGASAFQYDAADYLAEDKAAYEARRAAACPAPAWSTTK